MGRQQLDGDSIRDESIEGVDIKDGSISISDLDVTLQNTINNYVGGIEQLTSTQIAELSITDNQIYWHIEEQRYLVSDPVNNRWVYIGFDEKVFTPPFTVGTFVEDWNDTIDEIMTRWTGNIYTSKDSTANEFWCFDIDSTASNSTGPSAPYSGTHYIYTETSGSGDTIDYMLETTYFAELTNVNFYYHAYGSNMGTYYLEYKDEADIRTTVWIDSGDKGDVWNNVDVDFTGLGAVAIRFRHDNMSGFRADFALDNISLTSV